MMANNIENEEKINKAITEEIRSTRYFKDALDWYLLKYIFPISQRSYLIVITILSVIFAFVSISVFLSFLPLKEVVPIAIDVDSKVDLYSKIRKIGKINEDPHESVIRKLVKHYVETRESYIYDDIKTGKKLEYIKKSSSRKVFNAYKNTISLDNLQSPVRIYRKHTKRFIVANTVQFLEAELIPHDDNNYDLEVSFTATESNILGNKVSNWIARMNVDFNNVVFLKDLKKFSPLQFRVNSYKVTLVKAE